MNKDDQSKSKENFEEINNFCEECKKEDESVSQNLIKVFSVMYYILL